MVKPISRNSLIRKFRALGFSGPYSGAKHSFMVKEKLKVRIPNPHIGDISIGLIKELLQQAHIHPNDWERA